ncbi:MAG: hypothetical protein AAF629_30405, partial [Chloroflexota bacterium]
LITNIHHTTGRLSKLSVFCFCCSCEQPAVVIVAVGLLVTGATATQFVAIVAVIMVALVAFNIYETVTEPEEPHTS